MNFTETISGAMESLMETVSGDVGTICTDASKHTVDEWRTLQTTKATSIGAGAAVIPVAGYLTLPADVMATLRIAHRSATGICFLKLGYADDETFAAILGVWSGEIKLDKSLADQVAAKVLATSATSIGGKVGLKMSIKALNLCTAAMVSKKLGPKIAQKVAAKLTMKLAAKASTRWIPVISMVVGGGANLWIVNGIAEAAEAYAEFIKKIKT